MLYMRLLKLKEDIQNIIDLEVVHRYLRSLEGTPTFNAEVLQRVLQNLETRTLCWMCTTFLKS
jgi:hypothetical protein